MNTRRRFIWDISSRSLVICGVTNSFLEVGTSRLFSEVLVSGFRVFPVFIFEECCLFGESYF